MYANSLNGLANFSWTPFVAPSLVTAGSKDASSTAVAHVLDGIAQEDGSKERPEQVDVHNIVVSILFSIIPI